MAALSSYYKTRKSRKSGQWSWTVYGRNGEKVAWGSGLNREPDDKYVQRVAKIVAGAKKHKEKRR